jgi:hypothetical protein
MSAGAVAAALAASLAAGVGLWLTFDRIAAPAPREIVSRHAPVEDAPPEVQPAEAAERSATPDQAPDPRTHVHVRMSSESDSLVLPVQTKNPNVSIFWIYPAIKTAQAPGQKHSPPS